MKIFRFGRKKEKAKKNKQIMPEEPVTERPLPLEPIELANLQGLGIREEQQDAFGCSKLEEYEEKGFLTVLCDGMGGMAEGRLIATETVSEVLSRFPWEDDKDVPDLISDFSYKVFRRFRGHGGATLVVTLIRDNRLHFWSVGDSDLFLLREGKLYSLNLRQEYRHELILRALEVPFPVEEAFGDTQAGALSEFIGKEEVRCEYTKKPFLLEQEDTLLLCSDGVSDTLTLKQIRDALVLTPQECCDDLEKMISEAARPAQDNFTAIVIKYHGKQEEKQDEDKE